MSFRRALCVVAVVGLIAAAAIAAEIDGKWQSEMPGRDGNVMTTTYTFKAEGDKLTGTISGRQGDTPIAEGKISGDEISFVVVRNMGGEDRKIQYKGKISGDEIKMSSQFSPDRPAREFVAKRVK